jgi:hypothetical protein
MITQVKDEGYSLMIESYPTPRPQWQKLSLDMLVKRLNEEGDVIIYCPESRMNDPKQHITHEGLTFAIDYGSYNIDIFVYYKKVI